MKDCSCEATQALALNIPAVGCPIQEHDPIQVIIGLQLCDKHVAESKASDFLTADGRLEQIVRLMAHGRAEPDFTRAFTSGVSFDSKEWKALSKGKR